MSNEFSNTALKSTFNTPLLTTDEVAALCRTVPATVRYWRHVGTGPQGFKVGRRVLYASDDVSTWLEGRRVADGAVAR
ncbi:helix-turn-helix protein [Terracoccus luteus]|uniref:Helix-turn-helix protein n=1 Tax=Terracoccus luteus TaxID=53356 RepID=A0A495Y3A7_9MICO|nr:helix-turn-helix domain-containing protein [Terracoccus luteus]RKT78678.1 helix-turn-helix protein [Terracoccus luteus]